MDAMNEWHSARHVPFLSLNAASSHRASPEPGIIESPATSRKWCMPTQDTVTVGAAPHRLARLGEPALFHVSDTRRPWEASKAPFAPVISEVAFRLREVSRW